MLNRNDIPHWVTSDDTVVDGELTPNERRLAFQLIALEPSLSDSNQRALYDHVIASLNASRYGSTCTPIDDGDGWLTTAPTLIGLPGENKPFIVEGDRLYPHRNFTYEVEVAEIVRRRRDDRRTTWNEVEETIDAIVARSRARSKTDSRSSAAVPAPGRRPSSSRSSASSRASESMSTRSASQRRRGKRRVA